MKIVATRLAKNLSSRDYQHSKKQGRITNVRNEEEHKTIREYHLGKTTLAQPLLRLRIPMNADEFVHVQQENDQIETH
jgi:hypothetical protein